MKKKKVIMMMKIPRMKMKMKTKRKSQRNEKMMMKKMTSLLKNAKWEPQTCKNTAQFSLEI